MNRPLKKLPSKPNDLTKRLEQAHEWTQDAEKFEGEFPWLNGNERVKVGYQLRMTEPLHLKLKFLVEHEPNTSMHKIILDAIEAEVERRLEKYIGDSHAGKRTEKG